jgi:hypothetical protein
MSSNSSSTFQSFSTSSSSTTVNGQTTSQSHATYSDPSGTKTHTTSQEPGQAPRVERHETDNAGRRVDSGGAQGRIQDSERVQDVTEEDGDDEQKEKDRQYLERMEEEYAKREGGA